MIRIMPLNTNCSPASSNAVVLIWRDEFYPLFSLCNLCVYYYYLGSHLAWGSWGHYSPVAWGAAQSDLSSWAPADC